MSLEGDCDEAEFIPNLKFLLILQEVCQELYK